MLPLIIRRVPRFVRRNVLLWLLFIQVTLNGVENTVDELRSFVSREAASYFQGFVDSDRARSRFVKEFVNGEAKNVAVDNRHAWNAPMFRARTNALVQGLEMRKSSRGETRREFTRGSLRF